MFILFYRVSEVREISRVSEINGVSGVTSRVSGVDSGVSRVSEVSGIVSGVILTSINRAVSCYEFSIRFTKKKKIKYSSLFLIIFSIIVSVASDLDS